MRGSIDYTFSRLADKNATQYKTLVKHLASAREEIEGLRADVHRIKMEIEGLRMDSRRIQMENEGIRTDIRRMQTENYLQYGDLKALMNGIQVCKC